MYHGACGWNRGLIEVGEIEELFSWSQGNRGRRNITRHPKRRDVFVRSGIVNALGQTPRSWKIDKPPNQNSICSYFRCRVKPCKLSLGSDMQKKKSGLLFSYSRVLVYLEVWIGVGEGQPGRSGVLLELEGAAEDLRDGAEIEGTHGGGSDAVPGRRQHIEQGGGGERRNE